MSASKTQKKEKTIKERTFVGKMLGQGKVTIPQEIREDLDIRHKDYVIVKISKQEF